MAKYKLLLPKMGESVAEATIIRWNKKPGDYIEADETVMEIATDKVDSEVPSPVSGKLVEQLCKDDDIVQVGAAIAIIETEEPEQIKPESAAPVHQPTPEPPVEASVVTPPAPVFHEEETINEEHSFDESAVSFAEAIVPYNEETFSSPALEKESPEPPKQPVYEESVPDLKPAVPFAAELEKKATELSKNNTTSEARFYSPLVKNIASQEGITNAQLDQIPGTGADGRLTKDDLLAFIENRYNAATQPVLTPEPEKEAEPVAKPVAAVTTETSFIEPIVESTSAQLKETANEPKVESSKTLEPVAESPKPAHFAKTPANEPVVTMPEPVTETSVPKSVTEAVKAAPVAEAPKAETSKAATSMSGGDEIIEMDRMRRLIADHMVMSKHTSPHVTSFVEADVTNLVQWREKIKGPFEKREGQKITFTPLFIEAVVRAIKDMPMINIQVNGTQIIKKKDINISMATALPSGNLIVPVIKRADELNLVGLTKSVNDLADRARNNKLKPDDVQGGTFTITNVGTFGNVMGTPIINQPQVAILAVGAIRKKVAVIETLQGDMIGIRHMMFLSLSYDHRVVDGALGGSFVKRVSDYLENWDTSREF